MMRPDMTRHTHLHATDCVSCGSTVHPAANPERCPLCYRPHPHRVTLYQHARDLLARIAKQGSTQLTRRTEPTRARLLRSMRDAGYLTETYHAPGHTTLSITLYGRAVALQCKVVDKQVCATV